ncbi:MAG: AraC family transcriptional regulator [Oscillospiraceae bacterium]|nr:AraC family transcriptional regulator [Oscillospiraceae bacterium]
MDLQKSDQYKGKVADDFQIEHNVSTIDEKSTLHIHEMFEIVFVLSDGMRCTIGENTHILAKNTMLLFNNMDLHNLSLAPDTKLCDYYVIYFDPGLVRNLLSESTNILECFYYRPFNDPNILVFEQDEVFGVLDVFNKLNYCYHNLHEDGVYGRELRMKFLLGSLLIKINLAYRLTHGISVNTDTGSYKRIYNIMNYIQQNYAEDITLDSLATMFHIGKFYMCFLFKGVTGVSPSQYLANCRLMKAKEMLINNYSVDDVCGRVGYKNLSHFSRSFKQHVGTSPKQYQMAFRA